MFAPLRWIISFSLFLAAVVVASSQPVMNAPKSGIDDTTRIPAPGRWHRFTPRQDSAYEAAKRLDVGFEARLRAELRLDSAGLIAYLDSLDNTPEAIRRRNLTFDPRTWEPTPQDKARRNADLAQARDWGYIHPNLPFTPTLAVPLKSIWQTLGLIEDTSPTISYTLTRTQHVSVKVYDPMANLVRTLVDDVQRPGVYRFDWDFMDAGGRRVHYGDYIAEVIADKQVLLRKRIEAP